MSRYGICTVTLAPCRAKPDDRSEMTTQLLFGEMFELIRKKKKWTRIKILTDDYTCWIDNKQYKSITQTFFEKLQLENDSQRLDEDFLAVNINGHKQYLLRGSVLFPSVLVKLKVDIQLRIPSAPVQPVYYARQYLGAPYLWGGRSPVGIDCSGLVQMSYLLAEKNMPRDAWQQAALGEEINNPQDAGEGDLAFFENEEGKIIHVGFVLNNENILHASGQVRIDKLDGQGIYNKDLKAYTHSLRVIKRIV